MEKKGQYIRIIWTLLVLLPGVQGLTQKNHFYFNEAKEGITQSQFEALQDIGFNLVQRSESDTAVVHMLVAREAYGFLDAGTKQALGQELERMGTPPMDASKTWLLHFQNSTEGDGSFYLTSKSLRRHAQRYDWVQQVFITRQGHPFKHPRFSAVEDVNDAVRRLLFKDLDTGSHYVILRPDGSYFRYYGEYYAGAIWKHLTTSWQQNGRSSRGRMHYPFNLKIDTTFLVQPFSQIEKKYPRLIPYLFYNNQGNFTGVQGDFNHVLVPGFPTLNIGCEYYENWGDIPQVLRVMIRLPKGAKRNFNGAKIQAISLKHGPLYPISHRNFPLEGDGATRIFGIRLPQLNERELYEALRDDQVLILIDDIPYEFVAPPILNTKNQAP